VQRPASGPSADLPFEDRLDDRAAPIAQDLLAQYGREAVEVMNHGR